MWATRRKQIITLITYGQGGIPGQVSEKDHALVIHVTHACHTKENISVG